MLSPFVAFMMKNSKTGPEAIKRSRMELDTFYNVVKPLEKTSQFGFILGHTPIWNDLTRPPNGHLIGWLLIVFATLPDWMLFALSRF